MLLLPTVSKDSKRKACHISRLLSLAITIFMEALLATLIFTAIPRI